MLQYQDRPDEVKGLSGQVGYFANAVECHILNIGMKPSCLGNHCRRHVHAEYLLTPRGERVRDTTKPTTEIEGLAPSNREVMVLALLEESLHFSPAGAEELRAVACPGAVPPSGIREYRVSRDQLEPNPPTTCFVSLFLFGV